METPMRKILFLKASTVLALSAVTIGAAMALPIRYSSAGMHNDYGNSIAVNTATGDVYVAGSSYNSAARLNDMFLIKYNAAGVVQWGRFFGSPGNDTAIDVIFANNGIYVTGYVFPVGGDKNTAVLHYDQAGILLQYRVSAMVGDDMGLVLQRDAGGGIYVGGTSTNAATGLDFQMNKFTGGLVPVWGRTWGIAGADQLVSMVYSPATGLYVCGSRTNGAGDNDGIVGRFNPATGVIVNARLFPGVAGGNDICTDITTDPGGIPYMTMTQSLPAADSQIATQKLTPALATTWAKAFNAVPGLADRSAKLRVGPTTVVVAGSSYGVSGANWDYAIVGYDPATGAAMAGWPTYYNFGGDDILTDLILEPGVSIYVTGNSQGLGGLDDYATMRVIAGGILWSTRYHNFAADQASRLAFGPAYGSVYVTGTSADPATGLDFATGKYDPATGANVW